MKTTALVLGASLLLFCAPLAAQSIALVADLNGRYGSTEYHKRVGSAVTTIIGKQPDLVISAGDMVAGQKQPALHSQKLDDMWDAFNQLAADPLTAAGIPLAVTPGNHDGSGFAKFALERAHFEQQWANRQAGLDILPGSEWPVRYAARIDTTLLLSFDGTVPGKLAGPEIGFIAAMLERYREDAEAVVVFSHLPMWPISSGREREILGDPDLLRLLHRHDVTVYASGHHHAYFAGRDEGGMIHLAVGALGGNARSYSVSGEQNLHSFAWLEISGKNVRIDALAAPGFTHSVDLQTLPAVVNGALGKLTRIDP